MESTPVLRMDKAANYQASLAIDVVEDLPSRCFDTP